MISIERKDKIDVVSFSVDKLNANTIDRIKEEMGNLFDKSNAKVIIDLKGIEYIDSSGFALFLTLHKSAKNNYGILKFVNPEPRVTEIFRTLHLHTVFEIYNDLDTCIKSFR
ncbi:MAG: STAS domain-containing protein [Bacteroidales bacterium]|nr:STAS domain-containing protein [Bacteroidales bacterium]